MSTQDSPVDGLDGGGMDVGGVDGGSVAGRDVGGRDVGGRDVGDAGPTAVPAWVPAAGAVVEYQTGDGVLTNRFVDTAASYFERFHQVKIVNDYSSGVANPFLGPLGGVVYLGGGHAGTNDNSVVGLIFGPDSMTFARLADPSPYFGTATDAANRSNNSTSNVIPLLDPVWGDLLSVPAANHTYGHNDIIPPAAGGAEFGSYFSAAITAGPSANSDNYDGSHVLAINSLTDPALNVWTRAGATIPRRSLGPPVFTEYDAAQHRSYLVSRNAGSRLRWYDHTTGTWNESTGEGLNVGNADDPDSGALVMVPERGLLILMSREEGRLVLRFQDVSGAAPGPVQTAMLSESLGLGNGRDWNNTAFWCADTGRLVVGNILLGGVPDNSAVYAIDIPSRLGDPWAVERQPFTSGTMPWMERGWQRLNYFPRLHAAVVMFGATRDDGARDRVYVYRPHGS